jgi:hypothetical protein
VPALGAANADSKFPVLIDLGDVAREAYSAQSN